MQIRRNLPVVFLRMRRVLGKLSCLLHRLHVSRKLHCYNFDLKPHGRSIFNNIVLWWIVSRTTFLIRTRAADVSLLCLRCHLALVCRWIFTWKKHPQKCYLWWIVSRTTYLILTLLSMHHDLFALLSCTSVSASFLSQHHAHCLSWSLNMCFFSN